MCAEEGRWSAKEKKFSYNNYANPHLRKILDSSTNQVLVWKEIHRQLGSSNLKSPTLAYTDIRREKKRIASNEEYFKSFYERFSKTDTTVVGIVCMSGDKIIGCDVFAGRNLFLSEVAPLLRGYIEEAQVFGAPVNVPDKKVKEWLDNFMIDEASQKEYLKKHGKIFTYNGKVIHITAY
jgi:hypothetical protein